MIKCTSGGFRCHDAHVNIPAPVTPRHPAHSTSWLRHTHFSTLHDSSPERFLAACKSLSRAHSSAVSLSHGPRAQTSAAAASSQRRATTACAPSTSKTEACKPKVCSLAMASHPVTPEAISSRAMQPSLAGGLHPHCTQTYERKPSVLPLALARRIRPCFFGVGTPAYAQNSPITCAQCNTPARNHTTTSAFDATVFRQRHSSMQHPRLCLDYAPCLSCLPLELPRTPPAGHVATPTHRHCTQTPSSSCATAAKH